MKLCDLFEAQRNRVILVDFQPSYESSPDYNDAIQSAIQYINNNTKVEVIAFFNGSDFTEDSKHDVMFHYLENGLLEERLNNIRFVEKGYAFLRDWMDYGISDGIIIKVLRYMMLNNMTMSDEIGESQLEQLMGDEYTSDVGSIYFTDIAINQLKVFNNCLMGGGGRHECFKEIQLLMSTFNIRNKEVQDWIY